MTWRPSDLLPVCGGSRGLASVLLTTLAAAASLPLHAQESLSLAATLARPEVADGLSRLDAMETANAEFLRHIGGIISPSGQEHDRAAAVAERMRAIGLQDVVVTDAPNAVGRIPGRSGRALVFVSTLDDLATVAENQRAATSPPRIEGRRVVGPGTNTSLTTAAMLGAAEALIAAGIAPEHDIVFAAVAQEETGLRGMKALYGAYRDRTEAFVDVLGDGHSISYGAIGIHWWRIVATGPPGHTLGGGLPNVNQAIGRAVDRILSLPDAARTDDSRTRVNVAVLESGAVFNHKPATGWFSLDLRSLDEPTIERIESEVESILAQVTDETGIGLTMEPFQRTPGGQIDGAAESALVQTAADISRHLGYEPRFSNAGSSNMNVAIAGGTLAVGLGGSRGGARAEPSEWADIDGLQRTATQVFLLAAALADSL